MHAGLPFHQLVHNTLFTIAAFRKQRLDRPELIRHGATALPGLALRALSQL
jgi:hypothetical protein